MIRLNLIHLNKKLNNIFYTVEFKIHGVFFMQIFGFLQKSYEHIVDTPKGVFLLLNRELLTLCTEL